MAVTRKQMIECELNSHLSVDELMEMAGRRCALALMEEIRKALDEGHFAEFKAHYDPIVSKRI